MRVVVVDPSRTVLKAVSRLLESASHGVAAFVDAREAFDYIKSDREVSALLASAQLNSMSGLELCWETRLLSGRERPIYIILMSSNSDRSTSSTRWTAAPTSSSESRQLERSCAPGCARLSGCFACRTSSSSWRASIL